MADTHFDGVVCNNLSVKENITVQDITVTDDIIVKDDIICQGSGLAFYGQCQFYIDEAGSLIFDGLPVADPHVVGQLWSNAGVLTISAG